MKLFTTRINQTKCRAKIVQHQQSHIVDLIDVILNEIDRLILVNSLREFRSKEPRLSRMAPRSNPGVAPPPAVQQGLIVSPQLPNEDKIIKICDLEQCS